ncbi:MAG: sigma-70 family RNA polymerase sigma factor [Verrucomicrobia bacterium]|nr:sigma-70 family RNA polymerase sigma factor [Verrucomicrobiota bacterium]
MSKNPLPKNSDAGGARFAATRWTVVLAAREKASPQVGEALETLCRVYWPPLYAFARREGRTPHDAQDLTQAFFARLLEDDYLRAVAPEKGRFRSFLLVAFKRFMANEWAKACAGKRGGGERHVTFDTALAENGYHAGLRDEASAEKLYERRWALTLLDQAMARLREEFTVAGKARDFDLLKTHLTEPRGETDRAAAALGLSEGAARVAVHRLRRRFREIFREEIAHTVADAAEIDDEVRYLLGVLGG